MGEEWERLISHFVACSGSLYSAVVRYHNNLGDYILGVFWGKGSEDLSLQTYKAKSNTDGRR